MSLRVPDKPALVVRHFQLLVLQVNVDCPYESIYSTDSFKTLNSFRNATVFLGKQLGSALPLFATDKISGNILSTM